MKITRWAVVVILLFLLACFLGGMLLGESSYRPAPSSGRIDTVFVQGPLRIDTVRIETPPRTVKIYVPDTAARTKAEKQDIITSVKVERNQLSIEKLTPSGLGIQQTYDLPDIPSITIDGQGAAQIGTDKKKQRKEKWKKIWRTVGYAGTTGLAFLLGSKL